jgi:hypothetical protein
MFEMLFSKRQPERIESHERPCHQDDKKELLQRQHDVAEKLHVLRWRASLAEGMRSRHSDVKDKG